MKTYFPSLLLLALLGVSSCPAGELLFKDDFTAHGAHGEDVNRHLPAENGAPHPSANVRQSGSLGAWRYARTGAASATQITSANNLKLLNDGGVTLQLPLDEALAQGQALTVGLDIETISTGAADWWSAVRIGAVDQYYPVVGASADFGFILRANGAIQAFATALSTGDFAGAPGGHLTVILSDFTGHGSAFSGNGTVVSLFRGETLIGSFETEQFTEEFIHLFNRNSNGVYDNLTIERGLPDFLPTGWMPSVNVTEPLVFSGQIVNDTVAKTCVISDAEGGLMLRLNYNAGVVLDRIQVNGRETLSTANGAITGVKANGVWSTSKDAAGATVSVAGNKVTVGRISYGTGGVNVRDTWVFEPKNDTVDWTINREYLTAGTLEDVAFPTINFGSVFTWTGGVLDTGGVAWPRYIGTNHSYGAHTRSVDFWKGEDALRITNDTAAANHVAARFSHIENRVFSWVQSLAPVYQTPKHNLRRSIGGTDLWAAFAQPAGAVSTQLTLRAAPREEFRRQGEFPGLDGHYINELLDTIGRYGVIDQKLVGANGWLTGYICLHEPFFAIIGLALNDPNYTANLAATLDSWRDLAIQNNTAVSPLGAGRVLPRWHHVSGDNMPGTYTPEGLYEVQWGYLLDSQPDFVINVCEQFDLTGDVSWLRSHKAGCEQALDWLLARDADGDGLVEMMNGTHADRQSSDWLDVVYASGENAFVNALLYNALVLWSERELILGDPAQAAHYAAKAGQLKAAFIKPVAEGGLWNPANGWFVYWRNTDGSIHGDNLVTPVNFAAIAYGLATDAQRQQILDGIESRMLAENLFHWPLCFLPYAPGEGRDDTFPSYENGDIFLSWGELAIRSYAGHRPDIALKYVRQLLDRYKQDALSFQRYGRAAQNGLGDDILAGNSMTIAGLFRNLYGVRPQWNRMMLDPHLPSELAGTRLRYQLRGESYELTLNPGAATLASGGFSVTAATPFAISPTANGGQWFQGKNAAPSLIVARSGTAALGLKILDWPGDGTGVRRWQATGAASTGAVGYTLRDLVPGESYILKINGVKHASAAANESGEITFTTPPATSGESGAGRVLEVQPAAEPLTFADWRDTSFPGVEAEDDTVSGPLASAAGDGISNLLRFALGLAPHESPAGLLPTLDVTGNVASFSFPYQPHLQGLRWMVESSADLSIWEQSEVRSESAALAEVLNSRLWLTFQKTTTAPRCFFRLRITEASVR